MSYVEKAYDFVLKVQKLFNKKMFQAVFVLISGTVLFFGVMNVYAQDDTKISPDWEGTKTFYNEASSTDAGEDNMTSHSGQLGLNSAWVVFSTLAPELTEGGDTISQDPNVPNDLKIGVLGMTDRAWAYIYDESGGIDLVAHLQEEWVPGYKDSTTSLYADDGKATSGYDSLMNSGISTLWGQFRNIAYLFFVVVMIVIGFMIMFRSKIGGQTMVSLGNTIPSIIISLILITFSFAIAGLVIDMGGIIIALIRSIFEGKSVAINDFGALFGVLFRGMSIQDYFSVVGNDFSTAATGFSTSIMLGLGNILAAVLKTLVMGIVGILVMIIGLGVVAVGAIKLLIVMYKAYFELILNVILSPLKILIGTFPGNEAARINWFTGLIRNVLVFPIIYFIVNIPVYITNTLGKESMVLNFPEKLTGANLGDTGMTISTDGGYIGLIVNFVLRVFVLYYAAQAPKFAEAIIPVKETNRAAADAMANAKASMSKVPLVGGLFK